MKNFPFYSTVRNEVVNAKLNLSGNITQKEFKNLTGNIDTSDFALKTNAADLKARVDGTDVNKISSIDELQGKNLAEDSYLFFEPEYRYFETSGIKSVLSWKLTGLSDEKIKSIEND